MNRCIICHSVNNNAVFKEFGIDILKCKNCGHVFSSYSTNQHYGKYFKDKISQVDHFWWNQAHEKMYSDFCKRFISRRKGKLLDVGCGLGYFVKKITKDTDWDAYGYEISSPAVDFARNKLGLNKVYQGRVEDSKFPKKEFDIITLWDVIEHIPDPCPVLNYLHGILKDDGMIFIHTPNIKIQLFKAKMKKVIRGMKSEIHYLEAQDHINIYSMGTITRLLHKVGFTKVKFVHLYPIQSVSGSKSNILKIVKNLWFNLAKFLYLISFGKVNINNLFVIVKK